NTDIKAILRRISNDKRRKKLVNIIVVAEGDDFGGAELLKVKILEKFPGIDVRATILGHIQRGGSPTYFDRVQASRMGYAAVNALVQGATQVMVGLESQQIRRTPFAQAIKEHAPLDTEMLE